MQKISFTSNSNNKTASPFPRHPERSRGISHLTAVPVVGVRRRMVEVAGGWLRRAPLRSGSSTSCARASRTPLGMTRYAGLQRHFAAG
jgi:hypothetical protein